MRGRLPPQIMLVDLQDGPFWMGRPMDAGSAKFTTYLEQNRKFLPIQSRWCSVSTLILWSFWQIGWLAMAFCHGADRL